MEKRLMGSRDPYAWMNDSSCREFLSFIEDENHYFESVMKPVLPIADQILAEIADRTPAFDETVPYRLGSYFYSFQYRPGREYPRLMRRPTLDSESHCILDFEDLVGGADFVNIEVSVNPPSTILAYASDRRGDRVYTIKFRDLTTGEDLPLLLPMASANMTWSHEGQYFFYTELEDETLRWRRIKRCVPQIGVQSVVTIFDDTDPRFSCYVYRAKSGEFIFIRRTSGTEDEVYFIPTRDLLADPSSIEACRPGVEYDVQHDGDAFIIRTNLNNPDFQLVRALAEAPSANNWTVLLDPSESGFLESFEVFRGAVAVRERVKGAVKLRIIRFGTGGGFSIGSGDPLDSFEFKDNFDINETSLRYEQSSYVRFNRLCETNIYTGETRLIKQDRCIASFSPETYSAARLEVTHSSDVTIPITLLYKRNTQIQAALVYAYGAYGFSMDPYPWLPYYSLLDRGFAVALVHVRGGGELGRRWHDAGRRQNKQNSITDLIECVHYLRKFELTENAEFFAMGESAGGLLLASAINRCPELFHGIVVIAPFVDILNTLSNPRLPLTTIDLAEWGDPNDPADRETISAYAPYENIRDQVYPDILAIVGLNDTQVGVWEAAKWISRIRDHSLTKKLSLLKTDMNSGHMGKSGRFSQYTDTAVAYSFFTGLQKRIIGT